MKQIVWGLGSLVIVGTLMVSSVWAEESVAELKQQIQLLQQRVEQLEQEQYASEKKPDEELPGRFPQPRTWDPFAEMMQLQDQMNQLFRQSFDRDGNWTKGAFSSDMGFGYDFDIEEQENQYIVTFDMKGLDQKKTDIEITDTTITVKGEHQKEEQKDSAQGMMYAQSFGSFMKTIPIPADADAGKVKTEKDGDLLMITLPKIEQEAKED